MELHGATRRHAVDHLPYFFASPKQSADVPEGSGSHPKPPVSWAAVVAVISAVVFPPAGMRLAYFVIKRCWGGQRRGVHLALVAYGIGAFGTGAIVMVVLINITNTLDFLSQVGSVIRLVRGIVT